MKTRVIYVMAAYLAVLGGAFAQQKSPWIGRRVFTQNDTVLRVNDAVVDDEGRSADFQASGKQRQTVRVYRVEHVKGEWLWLQDEKSGIAGWVLSRRVIPYEQAIDYYTNLIRSDPRSSHYISRGIAWAEKEEYDIAIADYNEAIRHDPKNEVAYHNRGNARSSKKDYDKAIVDYGEAIRLDPKLALAYHNRGNAWDSKKEYDKAIADYNEAIRLNPKLTLAYHNLGSAWYSKKAYDKAIADYNEAIRLDPKFVKAYNGRAWLWATCPDDKHRDGKKAVESATRACELSEWKDARCLGALAAAQAEAGDFVRAVEMQETAHKLYSNEDKKIWGKLLDLYREKKPYRSVD